MMDLSAIVKAYDVRGVVPDQLDEGIARAIGAAFARFVAAPAVVTAYDMRESSIPLSRAFGDGVRSQGVDVVEAGLGSTDMLYFASGFLDLPGAMFTASHNPARYNGIKMCRAGAAPIGQDSGLSEIRDMAAVGLPDVGGAPGSVSHRDLLTEYAGYLRGLVDLSGVRPLTVVI
ncbi:MAG: phosphomannomutase/phosphoglucomutase, partial [Geodermatophilaceae bacterium]|nr:phosphomannomutase/phosphoglucomutase [Geodermatophilaceae bacterium]